MFGLTMTIGLTMTPGLLRSYNYTHYQFNSQGQQFSISPYLIHMLIVDTVFVYPVDPCDI